MEWGVLDDIVPSDLLGIRAFDLASFYAKKPHIAAQMIKRSINSYATALDHAVMHADVDQFLLAQSTNDHQNAARAYRDKKEPDLSGE